MPQEPEDIQNDADPSAIDTEDREGLEKALAEEKKKAEDYLDRWKRAQADFANYKRRAEQERLDLGRYANTDLILSLLPVIDDLERALDAIPPGVASPEWIEGIRLVDRKFRAILESLGLTPIKALGEPFDPNFHEALRTDKGPEGIIIQEFQKGYMIHDRLLRPARVIVGGGEEDNQQENKEV